MEIIELINSYIKYVYILLGVIVVILLIRLLVILARTGKNEEMLKEDIEYIKMYKQQIDEKAAVVDNTMHTSVPFFISVGAGISLVVGVIQDYFDTKPSRRSIKKSIDKVYRYKHADDTAFNAFTRKTVSMIKKEIK